MSWCRDVAVGILAAVAEHWKACLELEEPSLCTCPVASWCGWWLFLFVGLLIRLLECLRDMTAASPRAGHLRVKQKPRYLMTSLRIYTLIFSQISPAPCGRELQKSGNTRRRVSAGHLVGSLPQPRILIF